MPEQTDLDDLVSYLARTSRLETAEAARVLDEVLAFLDETPEQFVRRRHRALQAEGLGNAEIFERLTAELRRHRYRAPEFSQRQLRRIVYG
jgi:hypothetical protein